MANNKSLNFLISFLISLLLLFSFGCTGGPFGDHGNPDDPHISSADSAINGNWRLTAVKCNYVEVSSGWQQAVGNATAEWQILNRVVQIAVRGQTGCVFQTERSLEPLGDNMFSNTMTQQSCSPQCSNFCSALTLGSKLNISSLGKSMTVIDSSGRTLCEASRQAGPMTLAFDRLPN